MKKTMMAGLALGFALLQGAEAQEVKSLGESADGKFRFAQSSRRLEPISTVFDMPRSIFPTNPESIGKLCVSLVTVGLKAPSTAKFNYPLTVIRHPNGASISGSVDAQNSYGAMLRNNFFCNFVVRGNDMATFYHLY